MERKSNLLSFPNIVVSHIVEPIGLPWQVLPLEMQNGIQIKIYSAESA